MVFYVAYPRSSSKSEAVDKIYGHGRRNSTEKKHLWLCMHFIR